MGELSEEEMTRLASIVRDQFGQFLIIERFADVMLGLFEDIPGLECLSDDQAQHLLHELWIIYHDQGKYQADRSRIRCDH